MTCIATPRRPGPPGSGLRVCRHAGIRRKVPLDGALVAACHKAALAHAVRVEPLEYDLQGRLEHDGGGRRGGAGPRCVRPDRHGEQIPGDILGHGNPLRTRAGHREQALPHIALREMPQFKGACAGRACRVPRVEFSPCRQPAAGRTARERRMPGRKPGPAAASGRRAAAIRGFPRHDHPRQPLGVQAALPGRPKPQPHDVRARVHRPAAAPRD